LTVGIPVSVGVAPLNVTPTMGIYRPSKRSRMPPLGLFGLAIRSKPTVVPGTGFWARRRFSTVATVALCE